MMQSLKFLIVFVFPSTAAIHNRQSFDFIVLQLVIITRFLDHNFEARSRTGTCLPHRTQYYLLFYN